MLTRVQCPTVPHTPYHTVPLYTQYCTVPCRCALPCRALPCHSVLCRAIPYLPNRTEICPHRHVVHHQRRPPAPLQSTACATGLSAPRTGCRWPSRPTARTASSPACTSHTRASHASVRHPRSMRTLKRMPARRPSWPYAHVYTHAHTHTYTHTGLYAPILDIPIDPYSAEMMEKSRKELFEERDAVASLLK